MMKTIVIYLAIISTCLADGDSIFADIAADFTEQYIEDNHLFEKDEADPSVDGKYIHSIFVALLEDLIKKKEPIPDAAYLEVPD